MIQKFFNNLESAINTDKISEEYATSSPIHYAIVDNFLPSNLFKDLCNEITHFPESKWIVKQLESSGTRKESRDFTESPLVQSLMTELTAHSFVSWLTKVTNNENIIPDVHHLGAGLSVAPSGAYLGLHVDFNWNNTLKLNRKINLIFYANEIWEKEWNGNLEFWNKDKTECVLSIEPKPNRLLFWMYEEDLLHGFSKPLACPNDIQRQNLMTVYYTSNAEPQTTPHKSLFV
jgi:Rps23 Pro-64 3,4-dihydroxylase Tpa1-like proline 4-hydroxylase